MKKLYSFLLAIAMVFSLSSIAVKADSGTGISASFNTYGGKGSLDGSSQAKYYHLTPGNVSAQITSYSGTGNLYMKLCEKAPNGSYHSYGTNTVNSTGTYRWNVGLNSYHYYLYLTGSNTYTDYSIDGLMHDHY